jgi:hypothetical protein
VLLILADVNVDDIQESMGVDDLASTFSVFKVDPNAMIIDEKTIPCMRLDNLHCNDAMDVD